jgi:hypothetical protein
VCARPVPAASTFQPTVCVVALLPCTCRCLPAPPLPAETPSPQPPYPTLPSPEAASSLYLRLPEDAVTTVSLTHRRWRTPLPPPLYPTPLSPEDTVATTCLSSPPTEGSPPPPFKSHISTLYEDNQPCIVQFPLSISSPVEVLLLLLGS